LVYLAHNVRIGFYGYEMVAPLVDTQDARLAFVEDIALMKLDALLARAARKDFYDLYFICQKIPLRKILDLAPGKYPSVRDFETQTAKRLVYFENAEQDIDPQLREYSFQQVSEKKPSTTFSRKLDKQNKCHAPEAVSLRVGEMKWTYSRP
jgi:hypothetical protein